MQIITNHQSRFLLCFGELPEKIQKDFDYIDTDDMGEPRFFQYRGNWFDAHDAQSIEPDNGRKHNMGWAMRVHPGSPLAWFDAIVSDTYFSGTLWQFTHDGNRVIVGRYYS